MNGLESLISKERKISKGILYATSLAGLVFLASCKLPDASSSPSSSSSPPASAKNELSENTRVLGDADISRISSVAKNQFTSSDSSNYAVGQIVSIKGTDTIPDGFLGEVTSVSGNTVYTRPVCIEDAVKNVSYTVQRQLSVQDIRSSSFMSGVSQSVTPKSIVNFNLNINVDDPDTDVNLDGNVSFDSGFVLELEIQNHNTGRLLFKNVVTEESRLEVAALSSLGSLVDKKYSLAHYNFRSFTIYLPTIPPFPIVIRPKLEVIAGIKGGITPITTGFTQKLTAELGVEYKDRSWNLIKYINHSFGFTPPTFADTVDLKAYVGPQINFLIYGVAGPYAEADIYLNPRLTTSSGSLELYGGLEAAVGFIVKIFSKTLVDFSTTLFDFSKLLGKWDKPATPPLPPKSATVTSSQDAYVLAFGYGQNQTDYTGSYSANPNQTLVDTSKLKIKKDVSGAYYELNEALVQFPISSISLSSKSITSAKLKLYGSGNTNYSSLPTITARKVVVPWNKLFVRWDNVSHNGSDIASTNVGTQGWYEWNVTSQVKDWMNGEQNNGIELYTNGNTSNATFESGISGNLDLRPKLEITYTQ